MSPKSTTSTFSAGTILPANIVVHASGFAPGEYFYSSQFRNKVCDRIFNNRKITLKQPKEVSDVLQTIFNMIDYVNSQKENTSVILNRTLDDFVIPNEFKQFVRPNSVRYDSGDRRCPNLLPELEFDSSKIPSYNDYLDAISRYRSFYKKASSDSLVSLSTLRINRSFEEVRPIMSINMDEFCMVHYEGTPFIPLYLKYGMDFFNPYYWETSEEEVLNDWIILLDNN